MKEASGELSMTAVAVVAIAAIGVVFTTLIWPSIRANITRSANCSQAFNCDCGQGNTQQMCTCTMLLEDNTTTSTIQCPNSGRNNNQ